MMGRRYCFGDCSRRVPVVWQPAAGVLVLRGYGTIMCPHPQVPSTLASYTWNTGSRASPWWFETHDVRSATCILSFPCMLLPQAFTEDCRKMFDKMRVAHDAEGTAYANGADAMVRHNAAHPLLHDTSHDTSVWSATVA